MAKKEKGNRRQPVNIRVQSREQRLNARRKKMANASLVDMRYMGDEPILERVDETNQTAYGNALTWYNYFYTHKDAKQEIVAYVKKHCDKVVYDKIKSLKDWQYITTAAWIIKMKENGTVFYDKAEKFLEDSINKMISQVVEEDDDTPEKEVKTTSPFERIQKKNKIMFCRIEEEIDKFFDSYSTEFNLYEYLVAETATPNCINSLLVLFEKLHAEILEVDEGFEYLGKNKKKVIAFYSQCIDDLNRLSDNKKKTRKPREKKAKPVEKKVEGFKYQEKNDPLKLVSIRPSDIIGAKEIWLFNTKYNVITKIVGESLDIKGTSIVGITGGTGKRVRKPEVTLGEFFKLGKVGIRTFMDTIKSVDNLVEADKPYRSTEHNVILKALK